MRLSAILHVLCISSPLTSVFVEGFMGGHSRGLHVATMNKHQQYARNNIEAMTMPTSLVNTAHKETRVFVNTSTTRLNLSDTPVPDEELREKDAIKFISQEIQNMDINAIINSAGIILVTAAVLNQVTSVDAAIMRGWTPQEMAVRIPVDNWLSYSSVLEKFPVYTKGVTSATVYTIGDLIAQYTEGRTIGEIDRPRLLRSLLAGLIAHGPLSHLWYGFSEGLFEDVLHLRDWWGTLAKVAIDQTTWGPFWNNTYILLLGLMKMNKLENIFGEMKRTTIPLIVSGLKLWPLAHLVTYGLIPVENRLLWVDFIEIIWVVILATAAAGGDEQADDVGSADVPAKETN